MAEREWTGSVSVLPHSMREFANEMTNVARTVEDDPAALAAKLSGFLIDHAYTLSEWADAVDQLYARLDEGKVPTNAQGVALARFLRPSFADDADPGYRHATVMRGGMGLPDDYIAVSLPDGYVGGIDREGRTST